MIRAFIAGLFGGWKAWAAAIGVALLSAAVFLIRKSGEDAQKLRQARIDEKAGRIISTERTNARGASDAEIDREIDRWSR